MTASDLRATGPGAVAERGPRAWPSAVRGAWPALYGAAVGLALFAVAFRAMPDDALITLSFARNVAQHGCWCLSSGIVSNTATSPLNVWLLAAVVAVTGHPFWAAAAVLAGSLALVAVWMRHLGGPLAALSGPPAIASAPLFASAVGMETVLVAAVLVGLVRYAAEHRWVAAGVMVAAAWLARPDVLVPAVVIVLGAALVTRTPRLLLALPLGGLLVAPWVLFSWRYFGSAWANSVAVKWANGAWGGHPITDVAFFGAQWPAVTAVTVAALAAGATATVVGAVRRCWPVVLLGLGGAAHLAALATQDTPPIFYYAGPSLAGLTLALVLLCARAPRVALILPAVLVSACLLVLVANGSWWARGIAPIRQNWATDAQYAAIARDLPTDGVVLGGEIGGLAYYCADRCHVVDPVLSDPGRTHVLVARWIAEHPTLSAMNYRYYAPPEMIPVRDRLHLGLTRPGPGPSWPITRNPGIEQWATVEPATDPRQVAN